ncbi:MAG: metallophosphoesterase [Pseudomonadota bacterium]
MEKGFVKPIVLLWMWILPVACNSSNAARITTRAVTATTQNLKVAMFGDQDIGGNPESVLTLIKNEGAELILHNGDFDRHDDPNLWETPINNILGANFPLFAVPGNHDLTCWTSACGSKSYKDRLTERLARVSVASCTGEYGLNGSCTYKGLFFVLSGATSPGTDYANNISTALAGSDAIWKVCVWHKNQIAMQVGGKTDEVGWGPYEACRQGGAIILAGHNHSYQRTKTLTDMTNQIVDPSWADPAYAWVSPGKTISIVSGLGGAGIHSQSRCETTYPYGCKGEWARIYTSSSPTSEGGAAKYGALFCTFYADGKPNYAKCYFKNVAGETIDTFDIETTALDPTPTSSATPISSATPSSGATPINSAKVSDGCGVSTEDGSSFAALSSVLLLFFLSNRRRSRLSGTR